MVRNCDKNTHEAWKDLIYKYEVSDYQQESLNDLTNRWKNFRIKETSQYPDVWFNALFNLNLNFKRIKSKNEKYEDEMKERIFDVLLSYYKPVRVSVNVRISIMMF